MQFDFIETTLRNASAIVHPADWSRAAGGPGVVVTRPLTPGAGRGGTGARGRGDDGMSHQAKGVIGREGDSNERKFPLRSIK